MSDIVERLRKDDLYDAFNADTLCNEAADEIEKLRAENEKLRAAFQKYFGQSKAANVRAALGEKE